MERPKLRSPQKPDRSKLIGKQSPVYSELWDFVKGDTQMFTLEGYAGCGKTFCINMLVEELIYSEGLRVCVATPTHKAKVVVTQMAEFQSEELEYSTIHSLLGLKPIVTGTGKETFVRDSKSKNSVGDYDIIIIDESSMLDNLLFVHLMEELERNPYLKLIFVGDGKQLPPVSHAFSIPMNKETRDKHKIGYTALTEIVRQSDTNPIIPLSKEIRSGKFEPKSKLNDEGHGIIVVKPKDRAKILNKLYCSGKFEDNPNYCRMVAYRNDTVVKRNATIREMMYKEKIKNRIAELKLTMDNDEMIVQLKAEFPFYRNGKMQLPKYIIGDKVIVDKPIFTTDLSQILYNTNEELIIEDYIIEKRMGLGKDYKCYIAQTKNTYTGRSDIIEICHELDELKLEKHKDKLKKAALNEKQGSREARLKWITYYDLDKRFSRLKYAPCLTTYKSQGSTYDNIIIDVPDILTNRKRREVFQHLYVGVTRARNRAFLFV